MNTMMEDLEGRQVFSIWITVVLPSPSPAPPAPIPIPYPNVVETRVSAAPVEIVKQIITVPSVEIE